MSIRKKGTAGRIVCTLSAVLFTVLAASGCVRMEDAAAGSMEQEEPKVQIGLSFDSFVIERWMRERDVFVSAAKELGAEVNVQNANGDVQDQISQIEYFIRKQVDVIVVVAGDCEALTDVMIKAREAGIKTVSYDRLIQNAGCDLYISFDNTEVGRLMARSLLENIPDGGDIFLIQGPLTDHNVTLVREGIDETLAGSSLSVVYESNCAGWVAENAYTYTKEGLKQDRYVKGIICGNDDLASQAFRALSEERLAGKVYVTGQDGEHGHVVEYSLKLDSNPEFTGSVLAACARAVHRLSAEGQTGCKTLFDVPPAYLSPLSAEELRASML